MPLKPALFRRGICKEAGNKANWHQEPLSSRVREYPVRVDILRLGKSDANGLPHIRLLETLTRAVSGYSARKIIVAMPQSVIW